MNMLDALDYLTYCSYRYNRQQCPTVSPERWALIFGRESVLAMEARYQRDLQCTPITETLAETVTL